MITIVALLAAVTLGAPFGGAEAGAVSLDDGMTIEIIVEVDGPFTVVFAQPFSSFETLPPTALVELGDGTWGGLVQLPTTDNWSLTFDAFQSDGTTVRSDSATMIELGVDRAIVGNEPDAAHSGSGFSTASLWLVAAVVLILGALGALAWWTFSGDDQAV